ncbi:MAG: hypothetical protein IPM74_18655 [Crocinitomicaceae bacterium]|nr:hypothetical protein [Crocinitomicaceae bacterium]MBK8927863.1 hypothetical protein [Crocinitomicaceae bacterium]
MSKFLFLFLIGLFLSASSCKKPGCTNSLANNHNSEAKNDDGSCEFDGSCVFWFAPNNSLQLAGCSYVKIYVDEVFIGGMATSSTYLSAPACSEGGVTYLTEMGTDESKIINYKITNATYLTSEPVVYSGSLKIDGGVCENYNIP